MIGSKLSRFQLDRQYLVKDFESEGLNLFHSRPWEVSYACATLRDGIKWIKTSRIWYSDLKVSPDAARITRFDYADYQRTARPPAEVWGEFGPLLYSDEYYPLGHNILGFDSLMVSVLRRSVGLPPDHSWTFRAYDTNALSRAFLRNWNPDTKTPYDFLSFQYKALAVHIKSSLGLMCKTLGIDYDESKSHSADYDVSRNWLLFRELVFKLEI